LAAGSTPAFAALAAGVVGGLQIAGRALIEPLRRWSPPTALLAAVLAVQAAALGLLLAAGGPPAVLGFAVVFGTAKGMVVVLHGVLFAELYGPRAYGVISGAAAVVVNAAMAAAPLAGGILYDVFGGYRGVVVALAAAAAVTASVLAALGARAAARADAWHPIRPVALLRSP
jgi:predicted MFS family arabinose efflux permease